MLFMKINTVSHPVLKCKVILFTRDIQYLSNVKLERKS